MENRVSYHVKVSRSKNNGALFAKITNNKGEIVKEIYSHYPNLCEKANLFLLEKSVEILVWTDKLEDK